jgi:hypothetical protein
MTTKLFPLKKATKPGECHAMRCKAPHEQSHSAHALDDEGRPDLLAPVLELIWGVEAVDLCTRHTRAATEYAQHALRVSVVPEAIVVSERETQGAKFVGWTAKNTANQWLAKVTDAVDGLEVRLQEAEAALALAQDYSIETQTDLEDVGAWAQEAKAQVKAISAQEKEITEPLGTAMSRLRDIFKPAKRTWASVEDTLRASLVAAKTREVERNKQLMAEAADAHANGEDASEVLARVTSTAGISGISMTLRWVAILVDANLLPDAYIVRVPNVKALKDHCTAAGGDEPGPIPGVRFELDVASRIQAAK